MEQVAERPSFAARMDDASVTSCSATGWRSAQTALTRGTAVIMPFTLFYTLVTHVHTHTYIYIYTLTIAHAHTPIPHTLMDFETPCLSPLFFFQLGRMLKLKSNSRVLFFSSC